MDSMFYQLICDSPAL